MIRPSSAAGAYGNDGGSQPRPRHSLGGDRERGTGSSGGNAAALRRGNWAEEARMKSLPRVGGGRYFIYRPPRVSESRRIKNVQHRFQVNAP